MAFDEASPFEAAAAPDPLADLLFTLIAAVLPAILMLAPLLDRSHHIAQRGAAAAPTVVTLGGVPVDPMVAQPDGLRLTGEDRRLIGLDRIASDSDLRRLLLRLRDSGGPLLLVIEPGGFEAAFTFEPVAAAYGPPVLSQVRAREPCRTTHDPALQAACRLPA